MKLMDKLAESYAEKVTKDLGEQETLKRAFLAGFESAREEAIRQVLTTECVTSTIDSLGEEEVK